MGQKKDLSVAGAVKSLLEIDRVLVGGTAG
jgi:hypothetical protein